MDSIGDLNDLLLFAEVADRGSYTAAARALGMQTSKLSRRIRSLEEQLGVRLLNRTTRHISLTDAGRNLALHCQVIVAEVKAAKDAIDSTRQSPQGIVRISCPLGLLHSGVGRILSGYLRDNPKVRLLLDATNRRVDVIEEGLDLAIRVRLPPLEVSDLAVRMLGSSVSVLVASPQLIAERGEPSTLDDLSDWPTLSMASRTGRHAWHFHTADGSEIHWEHQPRLATDDLTSLRGAALDGLGVACLPRELVPQELRSGQLVHLLRHLSLPAGVVHAIFPSRRGMVPAVRRLLDTLAEQFESSE